MPVNTSAWIILSQNFVSASNGGTINLIVRQGASVSSPRTIFVRSTPPGAARRWARSDTGTVLTDQATLDALAALTVDNWATQQSAVISAMAAAGYL